MVDSALKAGHVDRDKLSTRVGLRPPSLWRLGGLGWWQLTKQAWSETLKDDLDNRAYELAYNFLVAAFPLLLVLLTLFGLFAGRKIELRADLFAYLAQVMPSLAYDLLATTLNQVMLTGGGGKITIGLLLALIAGSSGTTQLMYTLNVAYQLRETRSWLKIHLISLALTVVMILLITGALLLFLAGGYVAEVLGHRMGLSHIFVMGWKVVQEILSIGFVLLTYAVVYFFAPNHKSRRWHWISPGSVVGVSLWLAASGVLRLYLHFGTSYSSVYGSLGGVIIMLLWFYVTGFALLIGGEVNSIIQHAAEQQRQRGSVDESKAA
jgi:membrane protein